MATCHAALAGLLRLKGAGRYTAGAVACFAYEQPVAMVDTNVRRVLSRVFEVEPSAVDTIADAVVPPPAAYAWNQALMDLGATVCRAKRPMCLLCPLVSDCGGPRLMEQPREKNREPQGNRGSQRYHCWPRRRFLTQLAARRERLVDDLAAHTAPPSGHERLIALIKQLGMRRPAQR